MFSFLKRNSKETKGDIQQKSSSEPSPVDAQPAVDAIPPVAPSTDAIPEVVASPNVTSTTENAVPDQAQAEGDDTKQGWFSRLKRGLGKTRSNFTEGLADLVLGKKEIDDELLEELETQLLMADVGVEATQQIINNLTDKVSRKELGDSDALYSALKQELRGLLGDNRPLKIDNAIHTPYVILMVGINGAGKTTTIGKLAKRLQLEGKSVMLAAGDTFRAAAVEQLQEWGRRNEIPVIAQHSGADSASVIYDAVEAAKSRGVDVLIADTAGRLHTQSNLMEELKKVKRVMGKLDDSAPHEVMLVVDGGTGQNALQQAEQFDQTVGLTGITISKLDGTAKGGVIFAIAKKFGFPIRFIGVGEGIDDLREFDADDYVNALLDKDDSL
ncbi:Signal recognition particle receptor FtsY [hydrothermal vent metagenome]|uniref:Signal recognition particle receptor FtsY n=1 Tax=hydrothermal vent metagenome TaxID=652676 RepID=A0A3B0Z8R2_9ZZZZ